MAVVEIPIQEPQTEHRRTCNSCGLVWSDDVGICPLDGQVLNPDSEDPLIGTVLSDKYEMLALLGKGGMSVVYKARHKYMRRIVAVKVMRHGYANDVATVKRFQQEAIAVGALSHPHIMKVFDFAETPDGRPYLAVEFIEGMPLSALLDQVISLPTDKAVDVFKQVCEGLSHAHTNGIVHRDLKPSNIMIGRGSDGQQLQAKLVDFGLVKFMPAPRKKTGEISPEARKRTGELTLRGEVFGTTLYMSPEQCMGKSLDGRSDIYAMGCVMYETLCGRPPFIGDNHALTMQKHLREEPQPLGQVREGLVVPPALEAIIMKSLAKDPAKRQQTAFEVKRELMEFDGSAADVEADPVSTAQAAEAKADRKANRLVVVLAAVIAVLASVFAVWLLWLR